MRDIKILTFIMLFSVLLIQCNCNFTDNRESLYRENLIEDTNRIKSQSNNAENYLVRGITYNLLKDYDNALRDFDKAIELKKDMDEAYAYKSAILFNDKKFIEAFNSIDIAIKLNSKRVPLLYYTQRGKCLYALKKYDEAIKDHTVTIKAGAGKWYREEYLESLNQRVYLYNVVHEYEKSLADMKMLFEFVKPNSEHFEIAGNNYYSLKEYDKAVENFQKAISLNKNSIFSYLELSLIYIAKNNVSEAEEFFVDALKHGCDDMKVIYLDKFVNFFGKKKIDQLVKKYVKQ